MNTELTQSEPPLTAKSVVACDIDEVLCDFLGPVVTFHNEKYNTTLKVDDFHSYRFSEVWGGSHVESVHKVHDFFDTEHFQNIQPVFDAKRVLEKHHSVFEFHCVTSRQHVIDKATREWVEQHYPGLFQSIHFGNHFSKESPDPDEDHTTKVSKPDMCQKIGAVALIDDSMDYATQCATQLKHKNFQVALFGNYAWNKGQLPENTTRCTDWQEVDAFLKNLAESLKI